MTDVSVTNLPSWDGNREKIPALYEKFVFNNKVYLILKIDNQLAVTDVEKDEFSIGMSIRVAGANSVVDTANVLIKAGTGPIEEVADAFDKDDDTQIRALIAKFMEAFDQLGSFDNRKAFLNSKGITASELEDMEEVVTEMLLKPMIFEMLVGNLFRGKGKIM